MAKGDEHKPGEVLGMLIELPSAVDDEPTEEEALWHKAIAEAVGSRIDRVLAGANAGEKELDGGMLRAWKMQAPDFKVLLVDIPGLPYELYRATDADVAVAWVDRRGPRTTESDLLHQKQVHALVSDPMSNEWTILDADETLHVYRDLQDLT